MRLLEEVLLYIIVYIVIVDVILINQTEAQIISHELRRLAISTNQFGIDALKALDRIEPPDKVIVFSPICLSSSLMMIMMGSSKYQVVSSFKQALYVWSMKPVEINRGFKDIFEHIGLNQHQGNAKVQSAVIPLDVRHHQKRSATENYENNQDKIDNLFPETHLSLPKLMRMKELIDKSLNDNTNPWWKSINKNQGLKQANNSRHLVESQLRQSPASSKLSIVLDPFEMNEFNKSMIGQRNLRELNESSQMNAISNIYIQRGLNMNYNYNLLLRQYFKSVIHPVDFFRNAEETRQHINSLVSANTEGKIKDLVKKATFENVTQPKIMIITSFHFRATLDVQIKSQVNEEQQVGNNSKNEIKPQQSSRKGKNFIETEESLLKFGMFSNLDCSVIEIPFNNRLVSLIIVMPNNHNSTELLITRLSAQVLSDMVNSLIVRKISIEIPVIKFDRGPINVDGLLKELGLSQYFYGDRIQTSSETGLNKWMRPTDIVHETSIDIGTINPHFPQTEDRLKVGAHDEPQTTTMTNLSNSNKPNNKIKRKRRARDEVNHIKLDKPFLYFVLDSINGLVITMGRIRQ